MSFFKKIFSDKEEVQDKENLNFFARLSKSLQKSKIFTIFKNTHLTNEVLEGVEEKLLISDVGFETTEKIIANMKNLAKLNKEADSINLLKDALNSIITTNKEIDFPNDKPLVILIVGVNGIGKTTTIAKLANFFKNQGKTVCLAAGDTFRAAATEQLQIWGEKLEIPVISQQQGADSASVIFDAITSAKAKKIDIVLADTAGRLQNKDNLMQELAKISRVAKKIDESYPSETFLVLDATVGQNAISQVENFQKAANLTGLILTKLDGTAKGGVLFALYDKFKIPVKFLGIGEKVDDLLTFEANEFINALIE